MTKLTAKARDEISHRLEGLLQVEIESYEVHLIFS